MKVKSLFFVLVNFCLVGSMANAMGQIDTGPLAQRMLEGTQLRRSKDQEGYFNELAQQLRNLDAAYEADERSGTKKPAQLTQVSGSIFWLPYQHLLVADVRQDTRPHMQYMKDYRDCMNIESYLGRFLDRAIEKEQSDTDSNAERAADIITEYQDILGERRCAWWIAKNRAIADRSFINVKLDFNDCLFTYQEKLQLQLDVTNFVSEKLGESMKDSLPLSSGYIPPLKPDVYPTPGHTGPKLEFSALRGAAPQQSSFLSRLFPTRARKVVALGALAALGAGITYWFWNRK